MDTKKLQTFITVAKLLNFREAAEELNYSQSSVSDHINSLEQEFGVKLFERLGKKVFLNEYGQKLLIASKKMVQDEKQVYELFNKSKEITGSLRIGAAETISVFWLPALLKKYRTMHPKVKVTLRMADCLKLPKMLENDVIDIAFSLHDEIKQEYITQFDVFKNPTVFIAAPDHPLASLKSIAIEALENQSFIASESDCCYRIDLEAFLKELNIKIDTIMELSSLEAIKQCVKSGLGISLLPRITVEREVNNGELIILPVETCQIDIYARMIYHSQKWLSPAMTVLKDMVLNNTFSKI